MPNAESTTTRSQHSPSVTADRLQRLMTDVGRGSATALDHLMRLCWADLVRYAARQLRDRDLARDVVQEAFIQVWQRRRTWTPR